MNSSVIIERKTFEQQYNYRKVNSCLRCKFFKTTNDGAICIMMQKKMIDKIETYTARICDLYE